MTHTTSLPLPFPLARTAADHPFVFARAFNTFDPAVVDQLYEPEAGFVPEPGRMVTGAGRFRANEEFLRLRVPIEVTPRHTYVVGELALLIVDFVIAGTAAHGGDVRIEGTATDVARRGGDGRWRYAIDNPFGVAGVAGVAGTDGEPSAGQSVSGR